MDSGKTFNMLLCKTLHEKRTVIGLNVSAAMMVRKTPNTLLKKKNPNHTENQNKPKQKTHSQPPPKTNQK